MKNEALTVSGALGIGLTTVIGSGIWKDSLLWANSAGVFSLVAVVLAWVLMLTVGISYAECVGMFPQGGGPYSYVKGAFGTSVGAFTGLLYYAAYCFIGSVLVFLTALFSLIAAEIATGLTLVTTLNLALVSALVIFLIGGSSYLLSIVGFGKVALAWVCAKIILVVVVFSFLFANWSTPSTSPPSIEGFNSALNNSIWAILGFELMLIFARDLKDPTRNMPRAILITLPVFLVVYLFVSMAASGTIAPGDVPSGSGSAYLLNLLAIKTGFPESLVFSFAAFSAAGTAFAMINGLSRQAQIMADDGHLPAAIKRKEYTVMFSTLIVLVVCLVMVLTSDAWDSVGNFATAGLGLVLISTMLPAGLTAFYLRVKMPALSRPFKSPLHLIVFPLAILLSIYLILINYMDIVTVWPAVLLTLGVMALTLVLDRIRRGES
ncbi:MAG: amino acid permease [Candidatus Thorarchaeota archaeon]